jgi:hypothetical protein
LYRNQLSGGNGASVDEIEHNAVTTIGNLECFSQHLLLHQLLSSMVRYQSQMDIGVVFILLVKANIATV